MHVRHQMCPSCGTYNGRTVIDVKAKEAHQLKRRQNKLKAMGQPTGKPAKEAETTSSEK